jgi:uncharacterized protein YbjQ (UPF0145 family)
MLIVTTPDLPGYEIRMVLGPVLAVSAYDTSALSGVSLIRRPAERARALSGLHQDATRYGANAVVSVRFDTAHSGVDWAVGTAVWVDPVTPAARAQYEAMVAARRVPPQSPPAGTLPAYFGPVV